MVFASINMNWPEVYICPLSPVEKEHSDIVTYLWIEKEQNVSFEMIYQTLNSIFNWNLLIQTIFERIALKHQFSSVQSLSRVWLFATPWTAAHQASLSIIDSWSLLKLMSIELVMPSNHLILCCPLLLPPSIFPSIRVFSNESVLYIRWPKYWSFSFNISPSSEHSGLIFRMDWWTSLQSKGLSKLFSNTTFQKHQFFSAQLSSQSSSHIHNDYWKNHSLD